MSVFDASLALSGEEQMFDLSHLNQTSSTFEGKLETLNKSLGNWHAVRPTRIRREFLNG